MKFLARKTLSGLVPADTAGEDALRKVRLGSFVTVELKQPRNGAHHRLYWALIATVFNNQDRYATQEELHAALKVSAGICQTIYLASGTEIRIPGSIAFDKMDQTAFNEFYDRVCDLIVKHFLPGLTSDELKAEVSSMVGA